LLEPSVKNYHGEWACVLVQINQTA
jgi:hypothetical protein